MSDATLARMEHGKYVGVREESRRDGCLGAKKTDPLYIRIAGQSTPAHDGGWRFEKALEQLARLR